MKEAVFSKAELECCRCVNENTAFSTLFEFGTVEERIRYILSSIGNRKERQLVVSVAVVLLFCFYQR